MIDELKRQHRVIDMMLTAHSALRDKNERRALSVDLFLLGSSVLLSITVFIDPEVLDSINLGPQTARIVIGVCSTLIFFLSLVGLRVDWKQKAAMHNKAAEELGRLKAACRTLIECDGQSDPERIRSQSRECAWTLNSLVKIPEGQFLRLKALHERKVKLSRMVSAYPGTPVFMLRFVLWLRAMLDLWGNRPTQNRDGGKND